MAVVTSLDADHLDIYGDHRTMVEAYNIFCGKIRKGGNACSEQQDPEGHYCS